MHLTFHTEQIQELSYLRLFSFRNINRHIDIYVYFFSFLFLRINNLCSIKRHLGKPSQTKEKNKRCINDWSQSNQEYHQQAKIHPNDSSSSEDHYDHHGDVHPEDHSSLDTELLMVGVFESTTNTLVAVSLDVPVQRENPD